MERRMEQKTIKTQEVAEQRDFVSKEPSVGPITWDLPAMVEWLKEGEARTVKADQVRLAAK